ncbi:NDP-sugar synthase [Marinobacter qingdaonensis]|uniref:NDP-sugar synthase n=1 Tax=Marinobacter qingdaonensis TaxID=3108486 RepID=A0ABU5NUY4_9GAMM|nr:NDP-sugar synthase [Marinobacter sp. ASW11-75]MEA1079589.1 NDP-sugar synthase [Marinobacter sp. ASW11-75]
MKSAIVFADRDGRELEPLNDRYCPAMLPVLGKPLLEHALEHCLGLGVETVFVVINAHAASVRAYFESGARWSLNIHYVLSRQDEPSNRVRQRIGRSLKGPFVAMRGDIWHGLTPDFPCNDVGLPAPHSRLGYIAGQSSDERLEALGWQSICSTHIPASQPQAVHRPCTVRSLADYHSLSLATLEAVFADAEREQGAPASRLMLGAQTRVNHVSLDEGTAYIAEHSRVDIGAQLTGAVSVGRHCLIDRGTHIANSVLMDHTYVGAGLTVRNAIVDQDRIIRVDLDATMTIADSFLLWPNKLPVEGSWMSRILERLMALLLIPLGALIDGLYWSSKRGKPSNNYRDRLPLSVQLWAAAKGRIALFGRDEHTGQLLQKSSETLPWRERYETLPLGAISLARMQLPDRAELALIMLTELELSRPRTIGYLYLNLVRCCWSGLMALSPLSAFTSRSTNIA